MASFSKHFPDAMRSVSCRSAFHPDGSCWHAAMNNFSKPLPTCAKFFAPIFCFQLLRRYLAGDYNRDTLPELFDAYVRTTLTGYLGSACGQTCCCLMYNMLGKMYLHTTVLLPVCIGNLWGFAMPAQVNSLFSDYLVMMVTEALYRSDDSHFLLRLVKQSNLFRTALFMTMSAAILHTNRKLKTSDVVWFIQTFRRKKVIGSKAANGKPAQTASTTTAAAPSPLFDRLLPVDRHVCEHPGSCDAYVLHGVQNNLKIGICIELSRFVIDNIMQLRRSPGMLLGVLGQLKVRVIGFFIGYTTVYRIVSCSLNRYHQHNARQTADTTLAAFVSGSVFWLYPDLTILSHATVTAVKLLWMRYLHDDNNNMSPMWSKVGAVEDARQLALRTRALLARLPMSRLMYVLAIGYVFHLRLFYPWICSDLLLKTTFYTSGFISDQVTLNVAKHTFGGAIG